MELIVFHIFIESKCLSAKFLTSRWLSEVPKCAQLAHLTLEQLNEVIQDVRYTKQGACEVQVEVDAEEVLDLDITNSAWSTVHNTVNCETEHECLDEVVRLLNAYLIHQMIDDHVPGDTYSIPGLAGTIFQVHNVSSIWFIVTRWVSDSDMAEVIVGDVISLGKILFSVAMALIYSADSEGCCGVVTDNFVGEYTGRMGEYDSEQLTKNYHWRIRLAFVAETEYNAPPPFRDPDNSCSGACRTYIIHATNRGDYNTWSGSDLDVCHRRDEIWDWLIHLNLFDEEYVNLTHQDLNTSIDKPNITWNIHLVSIHTLPSRAKPSSNSQFVYWSRSCQIFDVCQWYKTNYSCWWNLIKAWVGFNLQVAATMGFHLLFDCCYLTMWMFSGASGNSEDDPVMKNLCTDILYSMMKSLMHAIQTEYNNAQQDPAHRTIQITRSWLASGKTVVWILEKTAHLSNVEWTEAEPVTHQSFRCSSSSYCMVSVEL